MQGWRKKYPVHPALPRRSRTTASPSRQQERARRGGQPREGEQGGPGGGEPPQPEQPPGVHGQYSFRSATWQETRKETASPRQSGQGGTRANPRRGLAGLKAVPGRTGQNIGLGQQEQQDEGEEGDGEQEGRARSGPSR